MTRFDKFCAILSIPTGIIFLILGGIGLFVGSNANFALPPVLGVLPFFLGWTMCVTTIRYWRRNNTTEAEVQQIPVDPNSKFGEFLREHPEFAHADLKLKMRSFHTWLARRQKQV